jgi:hypothetical protein
MNKGFIIFRFEKTKNGDNRKMYFTPALSWTAIDYKAMKADYETMKKIADKIKERYPDLIIERKGG